MKKEKKKGEEETLAHALSERAPRIPGRTGEREREERKGKKNKRGNGNTSESIERPKCDMGNGIAGWTGQEREPWTAEKS